MCGTEEENIEKRIWREDAGEAGRRGGGAKQDPVRDLVYRRNLLDAFYAIRYYPVVKFGKTPFYSLVISLFPSSSSLPLFYTNIMPSHHFDRIPILRYLELGTLQEERL